MFRLRNYRHTWKGSTASRSIRHSSRSSKQACKIWKERPDFARRQDPNDLLRRLESAKAQRAASSRKRYRLPFTRPDKASFFGTVPGDGELFHHCATADLATPVLANEPLAQN